MIQIIGLIISVYALARLLNEISNRYQSMAATIFIWIVSIIGIIGVAVLAVLLLASGATPTEQN